MADVTNSNWSECARCGSPLLIDPRTNRAEPCANCESMESPVAGSLAGFFLVFIVTAMGYLIYYSIKMLW